MKLELPKGLPRRRPSDLKMPRFATDLVHDLRSRRLLPLIALLLVAIVAAPFLLSDPGPTLTPTSGQTGLVPDTGSGPAELTVVAQTPVGLRDYRQRLDQLKAKNPFRQHFTAPVVAGANLGTAGATTTVPSVAPAPSADLPPAPSAVSVPSTPTTSPVTVTGGGGSSGGGGGNGNHGGGGGGDLGGGGGGSGNGGGHGSPPIKAQTQIVTYEIDASVGAPGKTNLRTGLPELTMLPNPKNPIAVFMGVTPDSKRALFLVSTDVTSVFGDVRCGFGDSSCQLIELEPGFPVTLTYGADDKRFRISVQKIVRTVSGTADRNGSAKPRVSTSLGALQPR